MNPLLRTSMNYVPHDMDCEPETGPSMTVPDMSLTIPQLVQMHSRGMELPMFIPVYADEESEFDHLDLVHMDWTEKAELLDQLKAGGLTFEDKLRMAREAQEAAFSPIEVIDEEPTTKKTKKTGSAAESDEPINP